MTESEIYNLWIQSRTVMNWVGIIFYVALLCMVIDFYRTFKGREPEPTPKYCIGSCSTPGGRIERVIMLQRDFRLKLPMDKAAILAHEMNSAAGNEYYRVIPSTFKITQS